MICSEGTRLRTCLAALLSFLVLGIVFWGLFQIDLPFTRFLRSIHIGWIERWGDLGTRLGSGAALVALSGGLLLGGWFWKQPHIQTAGFKTLLAHGLAAIVAQALKHGIGRPRPRFMHADNGFPWRPALESGLDSFPSGHTTASFAVAAVLAKSFPKTAWLAYALAGFVAISRAVRGSHFPTDVIAGMCLGTIAGMSIAYPIREWKRSLLEPITQLLPYLILVFSLLWLMTHTPNQSKPNLMIGMGVVIIAIGVAMRSFRAMCPIFLMTPVVMAAFVQANRIIVIGLALTTGLWLVTAVAVMFGVVQWLLDSESRKSPSLCEKESPCTSSYRAVLVEAPLVIGLTFAVVAIQNLKGLWPIFE